MTTQPLSPAPSPRSTAVTPADGTPERPQRVPAPGAMASIPNSDRPEVQIGIAFAGGLVVALILKRLVG